VDLATRIHNAVACINIKQYTKSHTCQTLSKCRTRDTRPLNVDWRANNENFMTKKGIAAIYWILNSVDWQRNYMNLTAAEVHLLCRTLCRESIYLSIYLSVCSSVRPSVCPSVRPSVSLSVCLSVRPSVHPSVRPSVRSSVCLSVRPSVCLSVYPSIYLSIYLSNYPSLYLSAHPSIYLPIHLSIHPSIHPSVIHVWLYSPLCWTLSIYLVS
jgi:hypothetical protein